MNKIIKISIIIFVFIIISFLTNNYIKERNKENNLKEKIGQMLIIGFRGTEANNNSYIIKTIKELNIGGVILFDRDNPSKGEIQRNIINVEQTKKLITNIKNSSSDIFISIDAEGGYVNRLKTKYGFENIPSAEELGKLSAEEVKSHSLSLGKTLKNIGINMDFAPVVDVNINPMNPVIRYLERSFSEDPEKVYEYSSAFIEGLHENEIISAIKHFPGHGSSEDDSHLGVVDITETYNEIELIPYRRLIEDGYSDIVMTAHIFNKNIDADNPATLSSKFLKDILRNELGFNGVIISDDMQMGAIVNNYGYAEAIIKAVNAGCDMLIISNNGDEYNESAPREAVDAIFNAVKNGKISEEQINESYNRIQKLKENYGIKK
ncbi:MAG: glycoside hydrolase family 3 protein [Candidatus Pacebacteria bacterium]|nr:glycoside hydrolase family 3 protein [Candidatus Paceibacterota bacterium]